MTNSSDFKDSQDGAAPEAAEGGIQSRTADKAQRRRRWSWVLGALAVALVVAASLWFGAHSGPPAAPISTGAPPSGTQKPQPTTSTSRPTKPVKSSTTFLPEMSPARPSGQVTTPSKLLIRLTRIESVKGVALVPGDIAGPAVRVTVSIKNTTSETISLAETVVNGYYGRKRTPADPLTAPGGRPFPVELRGGATAEGVYLFRIPKASRSLVTITVDTKSGEPAAVFTGKMA
ncbi:MAG: hypothetical protein WBO35_04935 [Candidatus Saccharimonadales bacterium]